MVMNGEYSQHSDAFFRFILIGIYYINYSEIVDLIHLGYFHIVLLLFFILLLNCSDNIKFLSFSQI